MFSCKILGFLRKFQGIFKAVLWEYQMCFKSVSKVFKVSFMGILRSFKGVPRKFKLKQTEAGVRKFYLCLAANT